MSRYFVVIDGKPQGPYSLDELRSMPISPDTFVRRTGMDDFKEAHAVEELRELLGFSYLKTAPQYFAGFDQRLLATAIDHLLILGIYTALELVVFLFVQGKEARIAAFLGPLPLIFLAKLIYGGFAESGSDQGTFGKKLLRIKVTDMEGSPINLKRAMKRNFSKPLSALPAFVGYLYSFFSRKSQCWHDLIAATLVIKDRLL